MNFARTSLVAQNVAAARALDVQIAALQSERANHLAVVTAVVTTTGRHTIDGQQPFTVSENNVYDEAVMRAALAPGQIRRVSVSKIDKPTVKRLYPSVYADAKDNRGVKVTL